jgi:hypothetical protein
MLILHHSHHQATLLNGWGSKIPKRNPRGASKPPEHSFVVDYYVLVLHGTAMAIRPVNQNGDMSHRQRGLILVDVVSRFNFCLLVLYSCGFFLLLFCCGLFLVVAKYPQEGTINKMPTEAAQNNKREEERRKRKREERKQGGACCP